MKSSLSVTKESVSVIVPVYNEKGNVAPFHKELMRCLALLKRPVEVIYVDDHSTDGTYEWLQKAKKDENAHISVQVCLKQGKKGKAFSLIEGFGIAKGAVLVMIDGDMQYPPSAIPGMLQQLKEADVIVSNRKRYKESRLRNVFSKSFRFLFAKLLLGLPADSQSGLKVFTRLAYETVLFSPASAWTFDTEFLDRVLYAGFAVQNYDITFSARLHGESKVHLFRSSLEIGFNALSVRIKKLTPLLIPPLGDTSMSGAGVGYKKRRYITHTTLPVSLSAMQTFSFAQKFLITAIILTIAAGLFTSFLRTLQIIVAVLSTLYFIDTVFNFFLVLRSLQSSSEIQVPDVEVRKLTDGILPVYSVLCPLYKELQILPQFLEAIAALDWPKAKLDIMLLLEEDDKETIGAIAQMNLPGYVRVVIVPDSQPRTKPKACNYGLSLARGEYLVIYDAEDIPDPLQLKKAYIGFQKTSQSVVCLQAKLNYYNPKQNILTRFFTAEYSLWFDLTLTGLQSFNATIPLGGTSNHFKTAILRQLQGWDPFNVTEDADLGVRLFQKGYRTSIIDSTTYEEATSKTRNWLKQRSRWIKGYMQTYLVHMRNMWPLVRKKGLIQSLIFQLTFGGKLLFVLINPLMWIITILYFASYRFAGPLIEAVYVPPVSYIAVFSFIFGNFLFLYCYMIGISKRGQWDLMKYIALIPLYWAMMSIAGAIALYQLVVRPHYWEKTTHGLHLPGIIRNPVLPQPSPISQPAYAPAFSNFSEQKYQQPSALSAAIRFWKSRINQIRNETPVNLNYPQSETPILADTPMFPKLRSSHFLDLLPIALILSLLLLDQLLAGHYLEASDVQTYLLLSFSGKTAYIICQTFSYITVGLLGRKRGNNGRLSRLLFFTFLFQWAGFVILGVESGSVISVFYMFGLMCFAIANVFAFYYAEKKNYIFTLVSLSLILLQIYFFHMHHENIETLVKIFAYLGSLDLLAMITLQCNFPVAQVIGNNFVSLFGLLVPVESAKAWEEKRMRILVFNWRDTKHIFAGGAEVYVHELARRWAQDGNKVTIFAGNDNHNKAYEVVDGVEIYRRGGTYTVYLFAMIYYFLKFRGRYDVIIDCENGLPFFTPLFVRRPVILLIFHVHQEIFRAFLHFPFNQIAALLEGRIMPLVYKRKNIVTISHSSRSGIIKLGFTKEENIEIVHCGVSELLYTQSPKTDYPSFTYLGRLKEYKNVDVVIKAFAAIVEEFPHARFSIVGSGEMLPKLKKLADTLELGKHIEFLGKVSEEEKTRLLGKSWAVLQPSQIEGWGITVIEANATGTPVIASRVSGLVDSIVDGKTGLLVEPRNIRQFALAMRIIVRNETYRNQLSREAFIWSKNFTWENSAQAFYQLIGKSLGQPGHQPAYPELALSAVYTNQAEAAAL